MTPTIKKAVISAVWHVGFVGLSLGSLALAKVLDNSFPVVEDFSVTKFEKTGNGILIEGSMRKVRDCHFMNVTAFTNEGRKVYIQFLDKAANTYDESRPVRMQLWGPWEVYSGKSEQVSLYAQHSCHVLWTQSTKLIDIPVGALNNVESE